MGLVGESSKPQPRAGFSLRPAAAFGHDDVEESDAPIYVWTPQPDPAVEVVKEFCDTLERWLSETRLPFVFIVMSDQVRSNDAEHRKLLSTVLKRREHELDVYCSGVAVVSSRSWVRGLVTAIHWAAPPRYDLRMVATTAEAREWARSRLELDERSA